MVALDKNKTGLLFLKINFYITIFLYFMLFNYIQDIFLLLLKINYSIL